MSLTEWKESVIKDNPLCRKCDKDITNIHSNLIVVGCENVPGVLQAQWYSQHKQCKPIEKLWTRTKDT